MKTHAILFTDVNRVEMGHVQIPDPADDEVVIETLYTCVSPGTECRVLSAKQDGMEKYPIVPGYANVGRVIGRGRLAQIPEGTIVFSGGSTRVTACTRMWGGHIAHAVQAENRVYPLPSGMDLVAASVAKLAAIAIHGSRVTPCQSGDRVLVVGLGPIGQLSARSYRNAGADVFALDLIPWRAELARKAGIASAGVMDTSALVETIRKHWPHGADIIVDCTGMPQVIPELIKVARDIPWDDQPNPHRTTTYVLQGSYASNVTINYWTAFMKEMRFALPRDHQPQDIRIALEQMSAGGLHTRDLVSDIRAPADATRSYAELQDRRHNLMTLVFNWQIQAGG